MSLTASPFDINNLTLAQRRAIVEDFRDALKLGVPDDMRVVYAHSPEAFGPGAAYGVYPLNDTAIAKLQEDENLYYCIGALKPYTYADTGKQGWRRTKEQIGAGLVVFLDDVGTKTMKKSGRGLDFFEAALKPTAVIETSPGNFQLVYMLAAPILDEHEFEDVLRSIVKPLHEKYGVDDLPRTNQVIRLPFGINNKRLEDGSLKYPEGGAAWRVRLVYADFDRRYTPQEIAAAYGMEIVRTEKKTAAEKRELKSEDDAYLATGFDLMAQAYLAAGRAWAVRTEAGLKYRICCPFEDEHASGGKSDDAFIADPEASKNGYFTFGCSHSSCSGKRTFSAALDKAGIDDMIFRDIEKASAEWDWAMQEAAIVLERAKGSLVAEAEHSVDEPVHVNAGSVDENVSRPEPKESKKGAADAAAMSAKKTKWSEGWYYLASKDRVVRPGELATYSKQGFDALFAREGGVEGGKAFDFVRKKVGFSYADGMAYVAGEMPVFTFKGQTLVNEFIPSSIPKAAAEYSNEGLAAVDTIRYHLTLLTGEFDKPHAERVYARMLESWIALNVRRPGKIIGIAPLIKGIPGDGKTVIFNKMMSAIMGTANVKEASTKEVCSDFNPYAYGAALRVIEELKMAGENRFAVADGIKPLITNNVVRVVAKKSNGIDLPNATNYVALTNHPDAVPIDDTDRRWFIVFTPWDSIADLEAVVGDVRAYFTRLHKAIEDNAAALVKYFKEDCAILNDFFHGMRAPITPWRAEVIEQEQALIGGDFFEAYVEQGEHGVSKEIILTGLLTKAFERDMPRGTSPKTRQISRLLKAKKWHRVPGVVKLGGRTRVVYVRDTRILEMGVEMRNAKLRELFLATMPADYEQNLVAYEANGGM